MTELAQDIVRNWLMSQGFFVLEGVRYKGQGELDFLAIKLQEAGTIERLHVEVSVSANPTTHLGQPQAGTGTDPKEGAVKYILRKFQRPEALKAAKRIFGSDIYRKVLVLGNVNKEKVVLKECSAAGIKVERFWRICQDLRMRKAQGKYETTDGRRFSQFLQLARQNGNRPNF
jgi:hypothetical protein